MKIIKNYNQYLAKILITFLVVMPLASVYAQTADTVPEDIPAPVDETQAPPTPGDIQNPSVSSDTVQDALTTQETIPADTLVQTEDPSSLPGDTTTPSSVPVDTETFSLSDTAEVQDITTVPLDTTPATDPDNTQIIDEQNPTDVMPIEEEEQLDQTIPEETPPAVVAEISINEIAPKESFKFSIRSERIETKHDLEWKGQGEKKDDESKTAAADTATIDTAPSVTLDSVSGAPVVSGSCLMAYYVILLYKNQTDYDKDPASYIINKAYPCVGGAYSFEIKDLPKSIPDGTYYLLVGEMGEKGPWAPMTSLVPIDITR